MYMRTGYIHQVVSIPFAGNDWCYHCHWNMLSYLLSFSAIKSWILKILNLENGFNKCVFLAFIHIGRYDIKARRHLACVQNGITQLGDWRMETWQLALRARCHVSIRQSPSLCNAILNTCPCLLAIRLHVHQQKHELWPLWWILIWPLLALH